MPRQAKNPHPGEGVAIATDLTQSERQLLRRLAGDIEAPRHSGRPTLSRLFIRCVRAMVREEMAAGASAAAAYRFVSKRLRQPPPGFAKHVVTPSAIKKAIQRNKAR